MSPAAPALPRDCRLAVTHRRSAHRPRTFGFSRAMGFLAALFVSSPALACPPGPVGLEVLIEESDQAIYVEVVDVEPSPIAWVEEAAANFRKVAVEVTGLVSEDLSLAVDELVPEIEPDMDRFHFTVHSKILAHANPHGPDAGDTQSWFYEPWLHRAVRPGARALVFLARHRPPLAFLGLSPLHEPDSVLVLPEHLDAEELLAFVEAGFANKRKGRVSTEAWWVEGARSPTCRVFLDQQELTNRVEPWILSEALLDGLTGTDSDLYLIKSLRTAIHPAIDRLAVDMMATWSETQSIYFQINLFQVVLERLNLPELEDFNALAREGKFDQVPDLWQRTAARHGLPTDGDPLLRADIEAWRIFMEESNAFVRQLESEFED